MNNYTYPSIAAGALLGAGLGSAASRPVIQQMIGPGYTEMELNMYYMASFTAESSRKAREFAYMSESASNFSLLPILLENMHATPQMVRSASNLAVNLQRVGEVAEPILRTGIKHGKKLKRGYTVVKPALKHIRAAGMSSLMPNLKALATTLPGPREYLKSMRVF